MRHANASALSSGDVPLASLRGDDLRDAYLDHLTATGRGNLPYERAARRFFETWPDPQDWAATPLAERLSATSAMRPVITFLMLHGGLRPGYDYLLSRKLSPLWREIQTSPLRAEIESLARRGRLDLGTDAATSPEPEPSSPLEDLGLTPREQEVLALVALGRTNGQIAETLFISPKTATVHVSNILAKLGASGRTEAAAIGRRRGLGD